MKIITSTSNPMVKDINSLMSSKRHRDETGRYVIEGTHLLQSIGPDDSEVEWVVGTEEGLAEPETAEALKAIGLDESKLVVVNTRILEKITQLKTFKGVMAVMRKRRDLLTMRLPITGDVLVIDDIQDPGNMGSMLRSAKAAGLRDVIVSRESCDPWSPKVLRAGMGAHFGLNIFCDIDIQEWIVHYGGEVWLTSLSKDITESIYDLDLTRKGAWIMGNEGRGVRTELLNYVSFTVHIPMPGDQESLNVAMATTVCLFEQARQRMAKAARKK